MTCTQLFVLRCDFKWADNSLIRRCPREILGNDRESSSDLRQRALREGWTIDESSPGPLHHLCLTHRHVQ